MCKYRRRLNLSNKFLTLQCLPEAAPYSECPLVSAGVLYVLSAGKKSILGITDVLWISEKRSLLQPSMHVYMGLTVVKCCCFCSLLSLSIQQEQFNLNKGKSLWNKKRSSAPVAQQAHNCFIMSDPQTQRISNPSQAVPLHILCTGMSHMSRSVQWKPSMLQTDFSIYHIMMESKHPSAYSHLSAEAEKQTMGLLWVHPQGEWNKIYHRQYSCFLFFHFMYAWQGVRRLVLSLFTAMELPSTTEAPILSWKCIAPT